MADLVARLKMEDGGFQSGIAAATSSLQKLDKEATLTKRGLDNFFKGKGVDEMKSAFDGVGRVLSNLEKKMGSAGTGMKQQLKAMTVAASELEQTYRNLSAAEKQSAAGQELRNHIDELISKAGELKDTMGDVQGAIKFASSDTAQLDAFAQGLTALSASAQVATGALSLFGVSEEKAAAIQKTIITLIGITNGLQVIQNALQKESNLMQFIKIAREQGLAAALGLRTAAQKAAALATEADTVAVEANTAALKRNPIGLIVTVVAAAAVAIYELTDGFTSLTGEIDATTQATETFNEEVKKQSDQLAGNIILINNMKRDMQAAGSNAEEQRKVFEKYRKKQVEVGLATKNAAEMQAAVVKATPTIIEAANLRIKAAAAEAAMQVELGKVLSKLSDIRAKLEKGETVGSNEIEALGANVMALLAKGAKAEQTNLWTAWFGDGMKYSVPKDKIDDVMDYLTDTAIDSFNKGQGKVLAKVRDEAIDQLSRLQFDHPEIKWDTGIDEDTKSTNANTKAKNANTKAIKNNADAQKNQQKGLKLTNDEIKALYNSYEGCSKIIEEADKKIKSLDKNSKTYNEDLERLRNLIIQITKKKLTFYNEKSEKGLTMALSDVNAIIDLLPYGSKEWEQWVKIAGEYERKIKEIKKNQENISQGIEKGSAAQLEQYYKQQQEAIMNLLKYKLPENTGKFKEEVVKSMGIDLSLMELINPNHIVEDDITNALEGYWKEDLLTLYAALEEKIKEVKIDGKEFSFALPKINVDVTFDYKKTNVEILDRDIETLESHIKYLQDGIKNFKWGGAAMDAAKDQLEELLEIWKEFSKTRQMLKLNDDIKEYKDNIKELKENIIKDSVSGIRSLYDSFQKLADPMDNAKNAFEGFLNVMDAMVSIYDTVKGIIDIIKEITTATQTLTGATQALSVAKATESAITETGTATSVSNAGAKIVESEASKKAAMGKGADAAAETLSQNSKMGPFGWIAGIAAALAVLAVILKITGAFANGGIVGGSSYHGDRLYARVNSGEMILNKKQQSNLFRMLDGGHSAGNGKANVEFKLKGSELVGVIKNYNDKHSKIR